MIVDVKKRLFLSRFVLAVVSIVIILSIAALIWLLQDLPDLDRLPDQLEQPSVRIVDRNGRLLYESIDEGGGRHTVVLLNDIPLPCQQATIATEDRSFYTNPGVELRGMIRAAWINLRRGEMLAGGSTITQQVVRNLLLQDSDRTIRRKLREIILAYLLSQRFSKPEILSLYLNQTYYGGMAYGIEAAAQTFFGKPVDRLDLAECALIAGLPQSPALYNPFTDFESAKKRQKVVLGLMESTGFINSKEVQAAENEPVLLSESPYPIAAPHFVMMVRQQIDTLFTPQQIQETGGLIVHTTLDLNWQAHAEQSVGNQLESLNMSDNELGHRVNNAALVALDPKNGDVLALVGSPDYFDSEHAGAVNMALSPRQPGSALKPFVYAAAFDPSLPRGGWTAATMILDVGTSFLTSDGKAYAPTNYDLREHGPVLAREALASSLNIPAVKALDHIGIGALFDLSMKLGITTLNNPEEYDLSLALGGGAVRLIDLTAAYGTFANGGYKVTPRWILDVQDALGNQIYSVKPTSRLMVMDERIAWLISDILSDPDARRLGFGANSILRLDRPAAVKTGTTSNFHDNWTIGYTPDLVVGVWSGNTDYQPMREVNGLSGAAPIWHEFIRTILAGQPKQDFRRPPGLIQVEVCGLSGLIPTDLCPYRRLEWFISGTQPDQRDSLFREVILDKASGLAADDSTLADQRVRRVVLDLPPEGRDWARKQGLSVYSDFVSGDISALSPGSNNIEAASSNAKALSFVLVSPAPGSVYRLEPAVSIESQRIRFAIKSTGPIQSVTYWIDGKKLEGSEIASSEVWWTLETGEHTIYAEGLDQTGHLLVSPKVTFVVLP